MSSRNAYLGAEDRERAAAIPRALAAAERGAREEGLAAGLERGAAELAAAGIEPEYLEARDAETLESVASLGERPVLIAVAAPVGPARLIDNVLIEP
jgi:pantoate--beta-alanine ligase